VSSGLPRQTAVRAVAAAGLLLATLADAAGPDKVARGAYLATAAGCVACHTDSEHGGPAYAGGRAIATPFGTFYSPNITPDPDTGIGRWSEAEFLRALRDGVRPDGASLFPVFPYTSYTNITDSDGRAIWAYLRSLPAARHHNRTHDVSFPFFSRPLLTVWKFLFLNPGPFRPDPDHSAVYNRGAYLVTALAHCGECHTPRNWLGAPERSRFLAGTAHGPDGKPVPNITPDPESGIGNWTEDDIVGMLTDGQTPDLNIVAGAMAEVVKSTAKLGDGDRRAIAVYLKSVPPIRSRPLRTLKRG
jgi:mono/diheme cytochrome c family protein